MKVLDLFAGTRGWSQPFADRGHETFTVELEPTFAPDLVADVLQVRARDIPWRPDVLLASPPCTSFSTMTMGRNWTHDGRPKRSVAALGLALVLRTRELIAELDPVFFIIENPRARLRSLGCLDDLERRTVWYCRYGEDRAKPTDLWGKFPPSLVMRPGCHNGNPDHIAAPRGSYTGTQGGVSSADAGRIPYELALDVCLAAEADLESGARPIPTTLWAA